MEGDGILSLPETGGERAVMHLYLLIYSNRSKVPVKKKKTKVLPAPYTPVAKLLKRWEQSSVSLSGVALVLQTREVGDTVPEAGGLE